MKSHSPRSIGPLDEVDLDAYVMIMAGAYPGLNIVSDEDRRRMRDRLAQTFADPSATIYGLYEDGLLLAGMILYDFTMNVRGAMVPAGGLGSLAVDLLHRKQRLAKEMVTFYLRQVRDGGASLALLYPFRPDFYQRMGFGYGAKMNQYTFRPAALRQQVSGERIRYLGESEADEILACTNRFASATHGMILTSRKRIEQMLANPALLTAGYVSDGRVQGYLTFDFEKRGSFIENDLRVKQIIYEKPEVLQALLTFLRTMADQCKRIVINTQDDSFHFLLDDPRNRSGRLLPSVFHESNTQGVGLMYRVLGLTELFAQFEWGYLGKQTCRLKITLADSFLPENDRGVVVHFDDGLPSVVDKGAYDAEIRLDISDFSSMFMGVISFKQLVAYGLASISDPKQIDQVSQLFASEEAPVCMTAF